MDRRTQDAKQVGRAIAEMLNQDLDCGARVTELEYVRAQRCRICGLDNRDFSNASEVRRVIDRELMNNSTYRAAVEAVEAFVTEWSPAERPTYAAVRNHSKKHLKRDHAQIRQLMEAYALNAGIDVENDEGSILTRPPRGRVGGSGCNTLLVGERSRMYLDLESCFGRSRQR